MHKSGNAHVPELFSVDCRTIFFIVFRNRMTRRYFFYLFFSLPLCKCIGRVERVRRFESVRTILRSFVQQYINYCKAIPLTYELYDENEKCTASQKKKSREKLYAPRSSPSPTTGTNCLSTTRTCTTHTPHTYTEAL